MVPLAACPHTATSPPMLAAALKAVIKMYLESSLIGGLRDGTCSAGARASNGIPQLVIHHCGAGPVSKITPCVTLKLEEVIDHSYKL